MNLYVIYENPSDYPGQFVLRRFCLHTGQIVPDEVPLTVADTLEGARQGLPHGVIWSARQPDDDPAICEVWL